MSHLLSMAALLLAVVAYPVAAAKQSKQMTASHTIHMDTSTTFQTMNHAGVAITESVAILLMNQMAETQRNAFLEKVFAPTEVVNQMTKPKAHLTAVRLTMGASDFNVNYYSYDDLPSNATSSTDYDLSYFSVAKDEATIIPLLKEIKAINPNVKILATPWSAPGWMKDSGTILGGSFLGDPSQCSSQSQGKKRQAGHLHVESSPAATSEPAPCLIFEAYAQYFVKFVEAYYVQHGLAIDVLTFQNEPLNSNSGMPSMLLASAVEGPLGKKVSEGLQELKQLYEDITVPRLFAYDHNWDNITYPEDVLATSEASAFGQSHQRSSPRTVSPPFSGAAFHCYGGDVSNQTNFRSAYTGTEIWLTECTGGGWAPVWADNLHWDAANLFIGNMENWGTSSFLWNLILTPDGGPKTGGGCMNCRGVFSYDILSGTASPTEDWFPLHNFAVATNLQALSTNGGTTARATGTIDGQVNSQALAITVNKPSSNSSNNYTFIASQINLEASMCTSTTDIQVPIAFTITLPSGRLCTSPIAMNMLCPSVSAIVFALTDPQERFITVQLDQSYITFNQTLADLRFDQSDLLSEWQLSPTWTCS